MVLWLTDTDVWQRRTPNLDDDDDYDSVDQLTDISMLTGAMFDAVIVFCSLTTEIRNSEDGECVTWVRDAKDIESIFDCSWTGFVSPVLFVRLFHKHSFIFCAAIETTVTGSHSRRCVSSSQSWLDILNRMKVHRRQNDALHTHTLDQLSVRWHALVTAIVWFIALYRCWSMIDDYVWEQTRLAIERGRLRIGYEWERTYPSVPGGCRTNGRQQLPFIVVVTPHAHEQTCYFERYSVDVIRSSVLLLLLISTSTRI